MEKIEINDDIKILELYRKEYPANKNIFKGFIFLIKLYKINKICKSIATKEIAYIGTKFALSSMFFIAAIIFNNLFISKGFSTGVNNYIVAIFFIFTFSYLIFLSNKRTLDILRYSQEILRDNKIKKQ